jgi:hypothetical protein
MWDLGITCPFSFLKFHPLEHHPANNIDENILPIGTGLREAVA